MTMTVTFGDPRVLVADRLHGALAGLWAAVTRSRARQVSHRQHAYLLSCDETVLSDIGLTRAEVRRATDEPPVGF
jgi:uncharacterized protein YjiS (DUF1127 family)